jgi:hypothetical protein
LFDTELQYVMRLMVDELFPGMSYGDICKLIYDNQILPVGFILDSTMYEFRDDDSVLALMSYFKMPYDRAERLLSNLLIYPLRSRFTAYRRSRYRQKLSE